MRRNRVAASCVALSMVLSVAPAARAQVLYGSLTGNVTDPTGSAVLTARVEAVNLATDDRGVYLMSDLQPGAYKVTISAASFGTLVQDKVQLEGNTIRR